MTILGVILSGLFGMAIASFLNVVIDRVPGNESIVFPASHCPACNRRLKPLDLVPVLSYLCLGGKCRYCGAGIPKRVFIVEAATAILFPLLYLRYGFTTELFIMMFYSALFLVLLVIDLEHNIIPDKIVYPAIVVSLIISTLNSNIGITKALIGGVAGFGIFLIIALVSRGGMGWGDVKMAALVGVAVGFPMVFIALFLAVISGGAVAVFLLLTRIKGRKDGIPFGPYLSLATVATLIWGGQLFTLYQTLFGL